MQEIEPKADIRCYIQIAIPMSSQYVTGRITKHPLRTVLGQDL